MRRLLMAVRLLATSCFSWSCSSLRSRGVLWPCDSSWPCRSWRPCNSLRLCDCSWLCGSFWPCGSSWWCGSARLCTSSQPRGHLWRRWQAHGDCDHGGSKRDDSDRDNAMTVAASAQRQWLAWQQRRRRRRPIQVPMSTSTSSPILAQHLPVWTAILVRTKLARKDFFLFYLTRF